jgi:hypothetical protein
VRERLLAIVDQNLAYAAQKLRLQQTAFDLNDGGREAAHLEAVA